jgi:hypothetical protein
VHYSQPVKIYDCMKHWKHKSLHVSFRHFIEGIYAGGKISSFHELINLEQAKLIFEIVDLIYDSRMLHQLHYLELTLIVNKVLWIHVFLFHHLDCHFSARVLVLSAPNNT